MAGILGEVGSVLTPLAALGALFFGGSNFRRGRQQKQLIEEEVKPSIDAVENVIAPNNGAPHLRDAIERNSDRIGGLESTVNTLVRERAQNPPPG